MDTKVMDINLTIIKLYDMITTNKRAGIEEIKEIFAKSALSVDELKRKETPSPKDLEEMTIGDTVVPLRGIFEGIPLRIKESGLREWLDDDGNVAGESRYFIVQTYYKNTEETTDLTFKLPQAVLKEI